MSNLSGINYARALGSKFGDAILDAFSHAKRVIMFTHSQIHEGQAYEIHGVYDQALPDNGSLLIQFKTPATGKVHLKNISAWVKGFANLSILENPTFTTGTTALTPINKERNCGFTSGVVAFSDPTNISGGVIIKDMLLSSEMVGNYGSSMEDVLKIDTTYIFKFKNLSGNPANMNMLPFWYEVE